MLLLSNFFFFFVIPFQYLEVLIWVLQQLFDNKSSQGKVAAGTDKGSVLQQAGEMAVKMYLKSQGGQQGGLLGLASKFM